MGKKMTLNHRERMLACLKDDPALDRPPVALWRHFPVDDQEPQMLARATLDFQQHYDFDLVKVTPASSFAVRDWGVEDAWEGNTEGTRNYTRRVVSKPTDWEHLPVMPATSRFLHAQVECLQLIRHALSADTPLLQTIFSPLSQAKNLAGNAVLLDHIHRFPEAVLQGLQRIALTTRHFMEACLETGIDGVFYAIQHAQAEMLSFDEYRMFGLPFDLIALEPAQDLWCNLLHLHGHRVHFELLSQSLLPRGTFHIINWHDRETPPSLAQARQQFDGVLCGGISQQTITYGDASAVADEARDALCQIEGRRFLLGTGCVVPVIAPHGNLIAARQAVEGLL